MIDLIYKKLGLTEEDLNSLSKEQKVKFEEAVLNYLTASILRDLNDERLLLVMKGLLDSKDLESLRTLLLETDFTQYGINLDKYTEDVVRKFSS